VWDFSEKDQGVPLVDHIQVGSTILIAYGSVSLKVTGFEDEIEFEKQRQKFERLDNLKGFAVNNDDDIGIPGVHSMMVSGGGHQNVGPMTFQGDL
jgi:hypothetical protein